MASHFQMHINDGTPEGQRVKTECRRFSHYVNNVRYWFALHRPVGSAVQVVSHVASGKKVCNSEAGYTNLHFAAHDEIAVARRCIDRLVEKHGAARVESVLRAAEIPLSPNAHKDAA